LLSITVAIIYIPMNSVEVFLYPSTLASVGNVGPKSDHMERSDLVKRFFIAGWERERAEPAKRQRQEGQGLKYPSVGLSMI
jgi:hypothetical protein